jgi:hypothetical protein
MEIMLPFGCLIEASLRALNHRELKSLLELKEILVG